MDSKFQQYVVGFIFFNSEIDLSFSGVQLPGENIEHVLLMLKDRPEWQAGKYNGIGGKVEDGEHPLTAMERECYEEAGLRISKWTNFARMDGKDFQIQCYSTFLDTIPKWESKTSERVEAFPVWSTPRNLVGSVGALISLARTTETDFSILYIK